MKIVNATAKRMIRDACFGVVEPLKTSMRSQVRQVQHHEDHEREQIIDRVHSEMQTC